MIKKTSFRQLLYMGLRLSVLLALSLYLARYLNTKNYADHYSKTLIKVHADAKINVLTSDLEKLLAANDAKKLQQVLDNNYAIAALVITDCQSTESACPGQKILFSTNPSLVQKIHISPDNLAQYPFIVMHSPADESDTTAGDAAPVRKTIGRVYSIGTIPSFEEDYRMWLKDPFGNNDPWPRYLTTMVSCLLGGFFIWLIIELFLTIRRIEQKNIEQREAVLIRNANNYLRQLEEKEFKLVEQETRTQNQLEIYIDKIKDLERKVQDEDEYREIAETIIKDLENEKQQQTVLFKDELEKTNQEKLSLQDEVEKYKNAPKRDKQEATRALESVMAPQFTNAFEKKVFRLLEKSSKSQKGEWLVINNFDVAAGKKASQFIDSMIICKDCLVVIEAKNFTGAIDAEGDSENTRWLSSERGGAVVPVKSAWGANPYHQVREYCMSLMAIIEKRSQWHLPVFGVVVFPTEADTSGIGERVGKYYRICTLDHIVGVLEHLEAEARRENTFSKRPSPRQIEDMIRGRSL